MSNPSKLAGLAAVLQSPRFWVNYVAILLVTCWVPLTSVHATFTNEQGEVLQESSRNIPLYQSYAKVISSLLPASQDKDSPAKRGASPAHYRAIGIHLGLSLVISAWVWYAVLRARPETNPAAQQADQEKATEESGGT